MAMHYRDCLVGSLQNLTNKLRGAHLAVNLWKIFVLVSGMFTDGQFYVASFSPTGILKPRVRKMLMLLSFDKFLPFTHLIWQVWSNPHSVPSEAGPHFDNFAAARFLPSILSEMWIIKKDDRIVIPSPAFSPCHVIKMYISFRYHLCLLHHFFIFRQMWSVWWLSQTLFEVSSMRHWSNYGTVSPYNPTLSPSLSIAGSSPFFVPSLLWLRSTNIPSRISLHIYVNKNP